MAEVPVYVVDASVAIKWRFQDEDASQQLNEVRPRYYDPKRPPAASKATVHGVGLKQRSITLDMIAVPAK